MRRLVLLTLCAAALIHAGCACAPLGNRTLPSGEDKYAAKYD